jgi:hypothetical protein
MKAKEYVDKFKKDVLVHGNEHKAISAMFLALISEYKTLADQRHAVTNSSAIAIARELEQRWQAICRLLPELQLNPGGFRAFWYKNSPEIHLAWEMEDERTYKH